MMIKLRFLLDQDRRRRSSGSSSLKTSCRISRGTWVMNFKRPRRPLTRLSNFADWDPSLRSLENSTGLDTHPEVSVDDFFSILRRLGASLDTRSLGAVSMLKAGRTLACRSVWRAEYGVMVRYLKVTDLKVWHRWLKYHALSIYANNYDGSMTAANHLIYLCNTIT